MKEESCTSKYKEINDMIKAKKIKFSFLNSSIDLELLECCYDKEKDTIEMKFYDVMSERIGELRNLLKKYDEKK